MNLSSKTIDIGKALEPLAAARRFSSVVMKATADVDYDEPQQTIDDDGVIQTTVFSHTAANNTIVIERWDYPPNTHQDWHQHDISKSGHIVSGELIFESGDGGVRRLTPFDPFYTYPNEVHRFSTKTGASLFVMFATGHPAHGEIGHHERSS